MTLYEYAKPIIHANPYKIKIGIRKNKKVIYAGYVGNIPLCISNLIVSDIKLGDCKDIFVNVE